MNKEKYKQSGSKEFVKKKEGWLQRKKLKETYEYEFAFTSRP